jgi:predicted transcriptional regulator
MSEDDDIQKAMAKLEESGKFTDFVKRLNELTDELSVPGPNEDAVFEERWREGLGVGLDADGNLVNAGAVADDEEQQRVDVQAGLDELDRGESVDLEEVLDKARAIVEDVEKTPSQEDE